MPSSCSVVQKQKVVFSRVCVSIGVHLWLRIPEVMDFALCTLKSAFDCPSWSGLVRDDCFDLIFLSQTSGFLSHWWGFVVGPPAIKVNQTSNQAQSNLFKPVQTCSNQNVNLFSGFAEIREISGQKPSPLKLPFCTSPSLLRQPLRLIPAASNR